MTDQPLPTPPPRTTTPRRRTRTTTRPLDVDGRIARLVLESGYTHAAVSRRLGVDRSTVSSRLRGETRFTARELPALAQMLGVTVAQLLEEDHR